MINLSPSLGVTPRMVVFTKLNDRCFIVNQKYWRILHVLGLGERLNGRTNESRKIGPSAEPVSYIAIRAL